MRFSPAKFNRHLDHIGQTFSWRKASTCPCVNPLSGAARPGCPHCDGKRIIWAAAVDGKAGVAGQKTQREWAQFGLYQGGDVVLTIQESSPLYAMGQFDRVVMLNSTDSFSLPLVRGQNDRIQGQVQQITRVFWIDGDDIVDGPLPDLTTGGVLSWTIGGPPAGQQYTVDGIRNSEYFCFGPYPSDRMMHHGARLPRRVVLRQFDLLGR